MKKAFNVGYLTGGGVILEVAFKATSMELVTEDRDGNDTCRLNHVVFLDEEDNSLGAAKDFLYVREQE